MKLFHSEIDIPYGFAADGAEELLVVFRFDFAHVCFFCGSFLEWGQRFKSMYMMGGSFGSPNDPPLGYC